jgi:hypothetical protein
VRVFAPEVISVLYSFSKKEFVENMEQLPFLGNFLKEPEKYTLESISIDDAIMNSNLQIMLKMRPENKRELVE